MAAHKNNGQTSNGNGARRGRPPKQSKQRETNGAEGGASLEQFHEALMTTEAETIAERTVGPRVELGAMEQVRQALDPLDEAARVRVLRWAGEAFGVE